MHNRKSWMFGFGLTASLLAGGLSIAHAAEDEQQSDRPRPPATRPTTRPGGGPAGPVSLHREMESMGRAFKQLQKQINDPAQNQSSLALVGEMEQHTMLAKTAAPPRLPTISDADRPKHEADYRGMMLNLLRSELDLEEQLMDGKNDKAAETLKAMDQMQDQGHKDFQPPKKKRGNG